MVKKELLKDGKKAIYARHGIIYASTEYKAQDDPRYEELKAVIEAQHSMKIAA